jgi:choice-of-anchor A domain-containing protein
MSNLSMRRGLKRLATIACASVLIAAPAAHASTFMDTLANVSSTYNLYVSGNLGSNSSPLTSDTEGKVATGGSAYFQNYEIGAKNSGGDVLVVGGDMKFQGGTIHGNVVTGGKANFPTGSTVQGTVRAGGGVASTPTSYNGTVTYTGLPLDFTTTTASLATASAYLNSAAAQSQGTLGAAVKTNGALNLTSSATGLVFFDINASDLVGINGLNFNVGSTATVIINLIGQTGGTLTNYGFLGNYQAGQTLFNFVDATSLTTANLGFYGSILAPNADVDATYGQFNGSIIWPSPTPARARSTGPVSKAACQPGPPSRPSRSPPAGR